MLLNNESALHFIKYHTRAGFRKFLLVSWDWLMGDNPVEPGRADVSRNKVISENITGGRHSSLKPVLGANKYKNLIDLAIAAHIKKYQNTSLMPVLQDSTTGGKRVRGSLLLSIVDQNAPEYMEAAKNIALCIEFIHCASLVFDDIMDGDIYRRGAPSIYYKHGIAKAQMAGLILLSSSEKLISASFENDLQSKDSPESEQLKLPSSHC
jgi:hypothetical protein